MCTCVGLCVGVQGPVCIDVYTRVCMYTQCARTYARVCCARLHAPAQHPGESRRHCSIAKVGVSQALGSVPREAENC